MSRSFSLPTILRMVPNVLLRQWLESVVPGEFDPDWDNLGEREIGPLLDYLTDLPVSHGLALEVDLRRIFDLACDAGMAAIQETAEWNGEQNLSSQIPEDLNVYGRSMWVRLNFPDIHASSATLRELDNLSFWRKRNDLPSVDKPISPKAREKLGRAVSSLLKSEGRGQQCTVEVLRRGDIDYVFVYPDDYVRCEQVHDDDGNLASQPIRPTTPIVFAYNRFEGTLETFARMRKAIKEELERIFASCTLNWKLAPYDPEQSYRLDHLKDETFRLTTDPADHIRVRIEEMKVFNRTTSREHTLYVNKRDPNDTIHQAIQDELNLQRVPLWQANVISVVFQFEFQATQHRRAGRQKIRVLAPHSCNLRSASPERVEIFQKYLKHWGIDVASSTKPSPVAVGA